MFNYMRCNNQIERLIWEWHFVAVVLPDVEVPGTGIEVIRGIGQVDACMAGADAKSLQGSKYGSCATSDLQDRTDIAAFYHFIDIACLIQCSSSTPLHGLWRIRAIILRIE